MSSANGDLNPGLLRAGNPSRVVDGQIEAVADAASAAPTSTEVFALVLKHPATVFDTLAL